VGAVFAGDVGGVLAGVLAGVFVDIVTVDVREVVARVS